MKSLGKQVLFRNPTSPKTWGIYLKAEHYKTWALQHRPRDPSVKSLGKKGILPKPDFAEYVGVTPGCILRLSTIERGIFSIVPKCQLRNPWENKHSFETRLRAPASRSPKNPDSCFEFSGPGVGPRIARFLGACAFLQAHGTGRCGGPFCGLFPSPLAPNSDDQLRFVLLGFVGFCRASA